MRAVVLGLVAILAGTDAEARGPVVLDPTNTRIGFAVGAVAGLIRTSGEFRRFTGRLAFDPQAPARSHVSFRIAADSLATGSQTLDDTLRSDAFLDTERFREIAFVSTEVERAEGGFRFVGNLTLHGVTRRAAFVLSVDRRDEAGTGLRFRARGAIARSAFGMTSGPPLVSDLITITVSADGPQ